MFDWGGIKVKKKEGEKRQQIVANPPLIRLLISLAGRDVHDRIRVFLIKIPCF